MPSFPSTPASRQPPAGLLPSQVPQFIVIGCDDNQHADGIEWVMDTVGGAVNPPGRGVADTFDGVRAHTSFYVCAQSKADKTLTVDASVTAAWKAAWRAGHEIGNHARRHEHGSGFSLQRWTAQIEACNEFIQAHAGIPRDEIGGFRAPYLEYNADAIAAAANLGMPYDTSVQLGLLGASASEGKDHFWPFTLDTGLPETECPPSGNHPGFWEVPMDPFSIPAHLGLPYQRVTGFDWNLWFPGGGVTPEQFLEIINHSLRLKYQGNRAPMNFGLHDYIYSRSWDKDNEKAPNMPRTPLAERMAAVREFIREALTLPDVRLVSSRELLQWLRRPVALR